MKTPALLLLLPQLALAQAVIPPSSPGTGVTTGTQTFAGLKTFTSRITSGVATNAEALRLPVGAQITFGPYVLYGTATGLSTGGGLSGYDYVESAAGLFQSGDTGQAGNEYRSGYAGTGGTGVPSHAFTSIGTLIGSTDKLVSFYNGPSSGTAKLSISKDGKILGTWAAPQGINLSYAGNGIAFNTGGVFGGDFVFQDVNGNPFVGINNDGIKASQRALRTCDVNYVGLVTVTIAAGSTRTKMCMCTSDGAGSPAFAWQNMATAAVGDATTCG